MKILENACVLCWMILILMHMFKKKSTHAFMTMINRMFIMMYNYLVQSMVWEHFKHRYVKKVTSSKNDYAHFG